MYLDLRRFRRLYWKTRHKYIFFAVYATWVYEFKTLIEEWTKTFKDLKSFSKIKLKDEHTCERKPSDTLLRETESWRREALVLRRGLQRSKGASVRCDWRTPDSPSVSLKNFTLFKAEWCNYMKVMQRAREPCKSTKRLGSHRRATPLTLMSFSFKFSQTNADRRLSNSIKRSLSLVSNGEITADICVSVNTHTEGEL